MSEPLDFPDFAVRWFQFLIDLGEYDWESARDFAYDAGFRRSVLKRWKELRWFDGVIVETARRG